jgi:hypothetical protein
MTCWNPARNQAKWKPELGLCPSSAIKVLGELARQNVPISGKSEGGIASSPATSVDGRRSDILPGFD